MPPFLLVAMAAAIFAAGGATGIKWQLGVQARSDLAASDVRVADAKAQIRVLDKAASQHAADLANFNNQLGNAREKIAALSGRRCLDVGTVRVLNAIGHKPMPALAGEPAGEADAPATGGGLRFATERDTASAIAVCRARYAEVASQVNQILDIEESRHSAQP